jgi:hypothetical protein
MTYVGKGVVAFPNLIFVGESPMASSPPSFNHGRKEYEKNHNHRR